VVVWGLEGRVGGGRVELGWGGSGYFDGSMGG